MTRVSTGADEVGGCRACGFAALDPVLDLGSQPLANALLDPESSLASEPRFPLSVVFCPACSLVQLVASVAPERLFADYPYFSSGSTTMVAHARQLVERLIEQQSLDRGSRVVEIASNDGYLLQWYQQRQIPVLGIEPAANVAEVARARGVPTLGEFFGTDVARRLVARSGCVDVVHGNNVLAHVPDLRGFLDGLRLLIGETGLAVLEVPYLRPLIERAEFDTIYHEHLSYFSVTALDRLFTARDLDIVDVERLPIHGGSLRLFARASGAAPARPTVAALLAEERELGMTEHRYYRAFGARVDSIGRRLKTLLRELRTGGHRIAAYGAAAKGATLLNHFQIGRETLDFVVDRSPHKQGRLMPGVGLPIAAPGRLLQDMPRYALLLAWNFADEILEQQSEYRRRGGRFIVPLPEPGLMP